ncbi:MAG TPA: SdrD B-like domain-containing protein [Pseudolysinimonas sp.]|jgi:fimbrial isopeptide formation D2 family protein/uncharacterized repeat protein (TIGR01451 family)
MPTQHGARSRAFGSISTIFALVAGALVAPLITGALPAATAAGTPDVQLTRSVAASTLYGSDVAVTLTAHQDSTPDQDAFNLTFTDIIPVGTSFDSGDFAPSQTIALADGTTELVWTNVADLLDNTTYSLHYNLTYSSTTYDVPQTIGGTAGAYVNTDPRTVPKVTAAAGVATVSAFTGSGSASGSTQLVPFTVKKSEPSSEGELLRGVHDHITIYTLTITNNAVKATSNFRVSDYLPAGLEFLGCTAGDTSAAGTEEYPGSGRIPSIATVPNCHPAYTAVTDTFDPDGTGPIASGVYTQVTWTGLGDLPANGVLTLEYAAAIPMYQNVPEPGVDATANLDNNPSTGTMTTDEESLVNAAGVTGFYEAGDVTVWAKDQVSAEDVLIHKSVDKQTIDHGQTSTWSLDIQSSEYTASTGAITVTDTIPDGLDWAGHATIAPDGAPVQNADGTLTVTWTLPGFTAVNSDLALSYQTTTRTSYRNRDGSGPVVAQDGWDNTVHLSTAAQVIDATGTPHTENVIDDSGAAQTAPGVTLKKEVALPADVSAGCTDSLTWAKTAGDFHPGDTVCYRLTVTYPLLVHTLGTTLTDYLPAGMTYQSYSATGANDVTGLTFTSGGGVLTWTDGGPYISQGSTFQVIVNATVTDPTAVSTADITSNLFKLRYRNSDGSAFQLRDLADVTWSQPVLGIAKKITSLNGTAITPTVKTTAQAGDLVGYTVTVTNTGKQRADNVSVRDLLPAGWTCAGVTNLGGGVCSTTTNSIDWTIASVAANGGTGTVSYTATAPITAAPGDIYTNTVGIRQYLGATDTNGAFTYIPANNIDPTQTPSNVPAANAQATAEVDVPNPTVAKTFTTGVTESGNTAAQATIGENVTYTITTTIPQGTTMYGSPTITDAVASTLAIQGTPTFTINGGTAQNATVSGQNITAALTTAPATTYVNAANSGDDTVVVTLVATVRDANGPKRTNNIANSAVLHWQSGSAAVRTKTGAAPNLGIVEPNLTVAKTSDAGAQAVPGQKFSYTITVTNGAASASSSMAHELTVVDPVPSEVVPLTTGDVDAADGATLPGGGVWNAGARTLTFTVASLAAGTSIGLTFKVRVIDPLVSDGSIHNTATVTTSSLAGTVTGERTSTSSTLGSAVGSGYFATGVRDIPAPNMTLSKTASPSPRTIGEPISYTLALGVPADTISWDATVIDTLPAGVRFDHLVSATCAMGAVACSPVITPSLVGTPSSTDRMIGFFIGDLATAASATRIVTIQYVGIVVDPAKSGDSQSNSARVYLDKSDKITGTPTTVPATSGYDIAGVTATAAVAIVEPKLTLNKNVDGQVADSDFRRATPGTVLHYTVTLTNTGTSTAYDAILKDTPDSRLLNYTPDALPAGVTAVDSDPSDGTLQWTVASVAVGTPVTVGYSLTVPSNFTAANEIVAGTEVNNTASVASYHGVPTTSQVGGVSYKTYTDVTPDTVSVELDLASIGDRVWFDEDGDGVQDAGEPGLSSVTVTVVYLGADGVFGTADDETRTTTTDASGNWLVKNLPGGSYRVTVGAGVPAGMTPSFDLDNGTVTPNGVWNGTLAENAVKTDVDFGYTGTGSIGDQVWFDRNKDGVKNAGEAGIAGATVTVVWGGQDGSLTTAGDNVTYTTTASGTGTYSVGKLPAGAYSVTVSGVPTGYTNVFDPDATPDGTTTLTLAAGENRTTDDFGYAGTGSIGDLVWLDRDGDGTRQPATEPGVSTATVTVVWAGSDGTLGTADDATFATTTATDGSWTVGNLVPGQYRVTVASGLANATNSYDADGDHDSTAVFTVANGAAVTTADFGYHVTTVIGDTVWWDLNGDGVQQLGEPGIPNVTVKVTYFGADGVLGGGDDKVETVTTDASGHWSVTNLPNGRYLAQVTAGIAAGFSPTFDSDGTGTPNQSTFTLTNSNLAQDFGYRGTGSIGDRVWLDQDADGVQDAGEPGLGGVTVTLTWFGADGVRGGSDDLVRTTTTDATGAYGFGNLPAGDFSVAVDTSTLSADQVESYDLDGGHDATTAISLTSGQARTDADFGFHGAGSIGDTVWNDRDADGTVDAGESGLAGVTVTAHSNGPDAAGGTVDDITVTAITDANGHYEFSGLTAGPWTVTVDPSTLPAGMQFVSEEDNVLDGVDTVTLGTSTSHQTADFGLRGSGTIGDTVYLDANGNGSQDAGEHGIPDQPVQVRWAGVDGALGTADDELWNATTASDGTWSVTGLPAGAFRVTVVHGIADAAVNTGDPDGGNDAQSVLSLATGASDLAQDFGFQGDNELGDTVWWDLGADGTQGATDPGLPDVMVTALWFGPDGLAGTSDDLTLTTTTDANGGYDFDALPDGQYRLTVGAGIPAGLVSSVDPDAGAPDGVSTATLTGGTVDLTQDFGYVGSGELGDTVWLDRNNNGVLDRPAGDPSFEPGIPNVTVALDWAGIDGILGDADDHSWTTTTDATGAYRFSFLPAGSFRITLAGLPADVTPTADPDGGTVDEADVSLASGQSKLDQDFGYIGDPSVGDTIYIDVNHNGVQDAGEPGLGGIDVTVRQAGTDGSLGTGDDLITVVTTDTDGHYDVGGLPGGAVEVSYDPATLPAGYHAGSDFDGGSASDTQLVLGPTEVNTDVDFAVIGDATLSGVVYDDKNANGVQDAGEPGLPGITVNVTWTGPKGPVTVPVVADASGAWQQLKLPAGDYTVTIDTATAPAGYRLTTGGSQLVTLAVGGTGTVLIGLTTKALALTGTPIFPALTLALILLLLGTITALASQVRPRRRPAHRV